MVGVLGDAQRLVVIRSNDAGETWMPWVEYDTAMGWGLACATSDLQDGRWAVAAGRPRPNSDAAIVWPRALGGNAGYRGRRGDTPGHGFAGL